MRQQLGLTAILLGLLVVATGCPSSTPTTPAAATKPAFTLAWSEYPSWSVFGVADESKLIDGEEGKFGPIEEKWGVDIVLKEAPYDSCLNMYAGNNCDAVCITNMDALNPAMGRKTTVILPTSTSVGADACLVVGINSLEELRNHKVYGLENTVSQYCFVRNLELQGEKEADHKFTNLDPAIAASNMQGKLPDYQAIMVWNPFVLQTLKDRHDAKVLFASFPIPGEIIDMVAMSNDSLAKPGGKDFACAVIETFYEVNKMLADKDKGDETLVALGEKFSRLELEDMKKVVQQTKFYKTPDEALQLINSKELPATMKTVVDFCVSHTIVPQAPKVAYGKAAEDDDAHLRFDPTYLETYKSK